MGLPKNHVGRAFEDTKADIRGTVPFFVVAMIAAAGVGIWLTGWPGTIVGGTLPVLALLLWNLYRAPFRQRNEARAATTVLQRHYEEELAALKEAQPTIRVTASVYNERAVLEVTNDGGTDVFRAKGRVVKGSTQPELYTMYWEAIRGGECEIAKGETATILVGTPSQHYRDFGIQLFRMGTTGEQTFLVSSVRVTRAPAAVSTSGEEVEVHTPTEECVVAIEISAKRGLREPVGPLTYWIGCNVDGIQGLRIEPYEVKS